MLTADITKHIVETRRLTLVQYNDLDRSWTPYGHCTTLCVHSCVCVWGVCAMFSPAEICVTTTTMLHLRGVIHSCDPFMVTPPHTHPSCSNLSPFELNLFAEISP